MNIRPAGFTPSDLTEFFLADGVSLLREHPDRGLRDEWLRQDEDAVHVEDHAAHGTTLPDVVPVSETAHLANNPMTAVIGARALQPRALARSTSLHPMKGTST